MIRHLIFDLDDTLYSQTTTMSGEISHRIKAYVGKFFGVSFEEGVRLRAEGLKKYGTTLEFLQASGLSDCEDYFSFVHPEDELSHLPFDPAIRPFLESLPMPKVVLTNAPAEHAERVLRFLRIRDLFCDTISDIRRNRLKGKPFAFAYQDALNLVGGEPGDTLFIDDTAQYVAGFSDIGGWAALVGSGELSDLGEKEKNKSIFRIKNVFETPKVIEKINRLL